MIILLDQDGVMADFDAHLLRVLAERHPEVPQVSLEEKKSFYLEDDYPEHREKIISIYTEEGFFASLPPIDGAIEGMNLLLEMGHDVHICTSPVTKNIHCMHEKWQWVRAHTPSFTKRLIITKDKTLVRGDVLVDDRPAVTGLLKPEWQHVLYDRSYNRGQNGPRMSWDKIDEFLEFLKELEAAK